MISMTIEIEVRSLINDFHECYAKIKSLWIAQKEQIITILYPWSKNPEKPRIRIYFVDWSIVKVEKTVKISINGDSNIRQEVNSILSIEDIGNELKKYNSGKILISNRTTIQNNNINYCLSKHKFFWTILELEVILNHETEVWKTKNKLINTLNDLWYEELLFEEYDALWDQFRLNAPDVSKELLDRCIHKIINEHKH